VTNRSGCRGQGVSAPLPFYFNSISEFIGIFNIHTRLECASCHSSVSSFELIEVPFDPAMFEQTLEDEFLVAKITQELEAVTDINQLRTGALKLLNIAVLRQGMIRGLCKRLAELESNIIRRKYEE
jgi:hypothetical protein